MPIAHPIRPPSGHKAAGLAAAGLVALALVASASGQYHARVAVPFVCLSVYGVGPLVHGPIAADDSLTYTQQAV
jgi:hypothetical protein